MNNTAIQEHSPQKMTFSMAINSDKYKSMITRALSDPQDVKRFITAITSAVAVNPALQECVPSTILSGALLGESLKLSPSPQLGQYYLVPFRNTKRNCTEAQFCLGYKGYIQLALRSGQYKKLNVLSIKEGELISWDPLNEEIEVKLIEDDTVREKAATIGYYAMFEYTNGFRKCLYWSREKMEAHALQYSKGYAAKKGYTFWEKDFDSMAYKTMLRQLISKWGVMSIDMQRAYESDTVLDAGGVDLTGGEGGELPPPVEADGSVSEDAPADAAPAAEGGKVEFDAI